MNDEDGSIAWLAEHPDGFVLNCYRNPTPSYLVMHRATCWSINGTPSRGRSWTNDPKKVCADTVAELEKWARRFEVP